MPNSLKKKLVKGLNAMLVTKMDLKEAKNESKIEKENFDFCRFSTIVSDLL